jgi:hypothetical protein
MTSLRTAAFAAALLVSGAAFQSATAMPVANVAAGSAGLASTAFALDDALSPGRPARIDAEAAQAAAEYFDFDALITFGALALAGGAMAGFAALAARRSARETARVDPDWRETAFLALQADLAAFTGAYRRAA